MTPRPEIRVKLSPRILKSIEVLQLATLDLKALIAKEMATNPTIELEDAEPAVLERTGHAADLVVERLNGDWVVRPEETDLPHVRVRPVPCADLDEMMEAGRWLAESIDYRRELVLEVTREIVAHEADFLERGPEAVHLLRLQDVADRAGIHVTTVARALADKRLRTPHGVFALRHFFLTDEEAHARQARARRIKLTCRCLFLAAALAGLGYVLSVWHLAEDGVQRPAALDLIAVAAGALVGIGTTLARRPR